jgi:serine/threonine-protein kinase RsbT
VLARQTGRDLAADLGFGATDGHVIATAISEVTRNIVKFAGTEEVLVGGSTSRRGAGCAWSRATPVRHPDVELALVDGHTTYGGLGLGLPGCRG